MKNNRQSFWEKLKNPTGWILVAVYFFTAAFIGGAIWILFTDYENSALAYVAYTLFALSAIFFAYTVYTIVRFIPKWKQAVIRRAMQYKFSRRIIQNFGFRTLVFSVGAFAISVSYGILNAVHGIMAKSIWYGALAAYYIFLALLRGGVLIYHGGKRKRTQNGLTEQEPLRNVKTYRNCGVVLLVLNVALSAAIAQMIFDDRSFSYQGWTIYASAAYAFYKITMSIINLLRARKEDDYTVRAIRTINLADGAVSILALQTALLFTFRSGDVDVSLFNTFTGAAVSLLTLALGVFMIVEAQKKIKQIQRGNIQ